MNSHAKHDERARKRGFMSAGKIKNKIMSAKEKEAAAKQTFTFLAPLTNEQPCEAGRKSA